jgi:Potential Queuosine, Q, salvage protein family
MTLLDEIREACAHVAAHARWVTVEDDRIEPYARSLPAPEADLGPDPEVAVLEGPVEDRAAFTLTLDAINFGSGWWPEIRKRPGRSGFYTMALGLRERFDAHGPWPAEELAAIEPAEVAATLGQDTSHELMRLYSESLRDLGRFTRDEHGGRFAALAEAADGSAVTLVETLGQRPCFADFSTWRGQRVPFLKRGQLAAADLHHARVASFGDLDRLTLFADNLVPHVLRVGGILTYDERLAAAIDAGELLEHGSEPEVEIRACAVEAVERMVRARADLSAQQLDHLLWNRGRGAAYKARPRHRARCTAY